jgi:hypothetical protein
MFKYYGYNEQLDKTIAFLRNNVLNVDIFALEQNGGKVIAPLGSEAFTVAPGDDLTVTVVIQNKGIAHNLVPEQRDFYESWVEFEAKDAAGRSLTHSGGLRADGSLDPTAHSFTNRLINTDGKLNDLHQVWNTRVIAYNNCPVRVPGAERRNGTDHDHRESRLPPLQSALHRLCDGEEALR